MLKMWQTLFLASCLLTSLYQQQHQMITITKSISFKWKLVFNSDYQWTTTGKLYNIKTMREIKKTVNGYSVGYWIGKKFHTIQKLRSQLVKIEKEPCPF